jgi:hypothetical protein
MAPGLLLSRQVLNMRNDNAANAGPTLRALSARALPVLGREGWGTRKIDSSIPAATSEAISLAS